MTLSSDLAAALGRYVGEGDGQESGLFSAIIEVSPLPNGGALLGYAAKSPSGELLHQETTMLVSGVDGRDHLHIAHSESPFVTKMVQTAPGSARFEQPEPFGPYAMSVVIERPGPDRFLYSWWWAAQGETPVEQSRADVRRVDDGS